MWPFSSPTKLWKIANHRVKKVTRKKRTSHGPHSHKHNVTRYKCVDCERVLKKREKFEDENFTCYEVIKK